MIELLFVRMFDMGFEPQVRSICDHVRPDRQCQLYSATFKKRIEKLARDVLTDPVKVVQGEVGVVASSVTQNVMVMALGGQKWGWLVKNLVNFMSQGSVLVFVTKKQNCEELAHNLKVKAEIDCRCLHGDMFQVTLASHWSILHAVLILVSHWSIHLILSSHWSDGA